MSGACYYYVTILLISFTLFTSQVMSVSEQQRLIDLVNEYRVKNGSSAVPTSYWLTATAMLHTIDRRDNGYPNAYGCSSGHSWSGESDIFTGPCCYSGANWECMGKKPTEISRNRFTGVGYENWVQASSVEAALNSWKTSPSHNEVILNLNGWSGSTWKSIGAGVCGGFYGLWFSETADPDISADIELLTCSMNSNGAVPAPVAKVPAAPSSTPSQSSEPSESSVPSQSSSPSQTSAPSQSSEPSITATASKTSAPSQSSEPSMTSTPSKTSTPSQSSFPSTTSTLSASSIPSMTSTPSKTSNPSPSASNSPAPQSPKLWVDTMTVNDNEWTTVTMNKNFIEPVIVCSMYYTKTQNPLTVRIKDAVDGGNTFAIQIDGTLTGSVDVHCVAIEAGTYTAAEHGITIEAKRVLSTVTNSKLQWDVGTQITFANSYTNPVVLGQVMTSNDPKRSVFYARGSYSTDSIISSGATSCVIGKQVGEDSNTVRANEQLGYIVIEAGTGNWGARKYEAIKGDPMIYGVGNPSPTYGYNLSGNITPNFGINSVNSILGSDGGYSVFYGDKSSAFLNNKIALAIDEDNIGDTERYHGSGESVGVLLFE